MTTSFRELIQTDNLVLVDFHATWCGPCKMMSPILIEIKKELGNQLKIIKVDVDKQPEIAREYGIQGVPTFILFKNANILWQQSGAISKAQLKKIISTFSA